MTFPADYHDHVGFATPPGCGSRAHFAAMAAAFRSLLSRDKTRVMLCPEVTPEGVLLLTCARQKESARRVADVDATPAKPRRQRNPRRPSIKTMIEQAEKADKPLASITLADGTKLDFGQPEPVEPDNSWPLDEFRTKEIKQ